MNTAQTVGHVTLLWEHCSIDIHQKLPRWRWCLFRGFLDSHLVPRSDLKQCWTIISTYATILFWILILLIISCFPYILAADRHHSSLQLYCALKKIKEPKLRWHKITTCKLNFKSVLNHAPDANWHWRKGMLHFLLSPIEDTSSTSRNMTLNKLNSTWKTVMCKS
jgi:hypothetical protein